MAGMEEQRQFIIDQELIERESLGPDLGHKGGQPVDGWCDLVNGGGHGEDSLFQWASTTSSITDGTEAAATRAATYRRTLSGGHC